LQKVLFFDSICALFFLRFVLGYCGTGIVILLALFFVGGFGLGLVIDIDLLFVFYFDILFVLLGLG